MTQTAYVRHFLVAVLAFGVIASALVLAGNIAGRVGIALYPEQLILIVLGLSMALAYLSATDHRFGPHWLDYPLAALSLGVCLWMAWRYPVIAVNFFVHETEITRIGLILIPLLLEALRRKAGISLVTVVVVFLLYAMLADKVPGVLQGRASPPDELFGYLAVDSTAMLGSPITIVVEIVVVYILFGAVLLATGGSNWFSDLATALVGRSRGGAAKMAIVSSAMFGSISGSAVANVASTGVITIPLMKRGGYSPRMAASFEAVASTGGQMMPPVMGAAAFLMAELMQVSYGTIVLAAVIPSALFFLAVLIQADLEAGVQNIPQVPEELIPPLGRVLREGWYFPLPFAVLIVVLFSLNRPPAEAAFWAIITILATNVAFGYKGNRATPRQLWEAILSTGRGSFEIVLIGAVAGIVIGVLQTTGLGFGLTYLLVGLGEHSLIALLFATAAVCILLGMGMPTTGIYLLVATLAAPPLLQLGVPPIAANFFIFYFGMLSMISPPVAVAAFTAASIAGCSAMGTAITSVRIGWTAFIVPFLFVFSPSLLMQGAWHTIALDVGTAVVGVWLISVAIVGFFRQPIPAVVRVWLAVAGALVLVPSSILASSLWWHGLGLVMAGLWMWRYRETQLPRWG
ncbi:TRAP transporter permease [Roseicitreum antarcticum]|uniref:TRAP transporter, 4TM/12TM fusion protein n=1 Tax=Roseicitreum antarcticum TaxID=564137 RepID=A0A1H2W2C2_9RHOB|nr:TRAP transporter fused permease subunit [Roseicitreum antarcticum]SDW74703.1 TRAP transporter, 4TM/12TM fusion protein [Roseicitreum antarcticum]